MPGPTTEVLNDDLKELKADVRKLAEMLEAEHTQRLEYARIEHERRMEVIEAEAALVDERYRRMAEEIAPSREDLREIRAKLVPSTISYDDEGEMPY